MYVHIENGARANEWENSAHDTVSAVCFTLRTHQIIKYLTIHNSLGFFRSSADEC